MVSIRDSLVQDLQTDHRISVERTSFDLGLHREKSSNSVPLWVCVALRKLL